MSTTDDIMALADAYAAAKAEVVIRQDADSFWAVIWRERCARSGEKLRAAVNALVAGRHESVLERDSVVDRLAEVVAERDALRQDATRYHWLRDWLAFEGLLWCSFCKPPDAPIGNYWVLRTPAMVNGSSCEGYGNSEDAAIDAAMKEKT